MYFFWVAGGAGVAYLVYQNYTEHRPVHNQPHEEGAESLPEDSEMKEKSGLDYDLVPVDHKARSYKHYTHTNLVNTAINQAAYNPLIDVPEAERRDEFNRLIIQSAFDRA